MESHFIDLDSEQFEMQITFRLLVQIISRSGLAAKYIFNVLFSIQGEFIDY